MLSYEGRALMNGISALTKVISQDLWPCKDPMRGLQPRRGPSSNHAGTLVLDFQPPEL